MYLFTCSLNYRQLALNRLNWIFRSQFPLSVHRRTNLYFILISSTLNGALFPLYSILYLFISIKAYGELYSYQRKSKRGMGAFEFTHKKTAFNSTGMVSQASPPWFLCQLKTEVACDSPVEIKLFSIQIYLLLGNGLQYKFMIMLATTLQITTALRKLIIRFRS